MKQIKAHIAVSLDGHTATLDKELDWLPREIKNIVGKQYLEADCLLMGANTYNYIFPDFVIAYPKNLRRRVLRFFGALPLASFACKCLCLGGA